jgi:DNA-binding NtrC family response regulator
MHGKDGFIPDVWILAMAIDTRNFYRFSDTALNAIRLSFLTDLASDTRLALGSVRCMSLPGKQPRYFHLLWDEDLDELREVLECIRDRRDDVLSTWYELYLLHFGDQRSLSEPDFRHIFDPALARNQEALLRKDMDSYAASVLLTGRQLAEQHVPLDELIAAVQLFEEAAQTVFPHDPPPSTAVYNKFDKLSHIRIILLVGAYVRLESAAASARIHALELEARNLPPEERTRFHGLIGHTAVMRGLFQRIETMARTNEPSLIVGERGTGKELLARAVHECGPRRDGPFAVLRCAALPGYLIENELFGYKRQGMNGGPALYLGLYCAAEGGTLLLHEITAMPLQVQERLVRIFAAAKSPIVAGKPGIIATTSRDPQQAIRVGQVREDFYSCFGDRVVQVPPLRERVDDLPLLTRHFIDMLNERMARRDRVMGIGDPALEAMERYPWPGNVQELYDAIETAFVSGRSEIIGLGDLPAEISGISGQAVPLPTISFETFADAECAVLKRALELTGGNKVRAAKLLKISRKKLYSGIAKYGIKEVLD